MASATSDAPSAPAAAAVEALVEALQLLDLSADALGHVLFRLPDAEDIARAAPACKAFSAAASHATKLRADALPFLLQRATNEPALRAVRSAEAALRPVHTIAASNFHSHVIGYAGTLYTWGGDGEGGGDHRRRALQLGDPRGHAVGRRLARPRAPRLLHLRGRARVWTTRRARPRPAREGHARDARSRRTGESCADARSPCERRGAEGREESVSAPEPRVSFRRVSAETSEGNRGLTRPQNSG